VPLYQSTLSWLHHNRRETVNKTDVANYWHDYQSEEIAGAAGAALTDAAVFFMRVVDSAGLGKFISAGVGRVTHLEVDKEALASFVTQAPIAKPEEKPDEDEKPPPPPPAPPPPAPEFSVQRGLQVNVEIHIAADAKAATIEEIFKNMQRYLMQPAESDGS
jgi:hypothetical protein